MALHVYPQCFDSLGDVLDDVKQKQLWPTTFVSGASPGLPVHWHDHDVHAYLIEGETDFFDAANDRRIPVKAGDKVLVEAGTLHAEGSVADRVVYVLAVPSPMAPDEFLAMKDSAEI